MRAAKEGYIMIILGLDGVSFNVLKPLFNSGHMPVLNELLKGGISYKLRSTIPPTSAGAWTALATGLDINESKVYDFLVLDSSRTRLRPVFLTSFRGRMVWDILSKKGIRVGVFNYPLLYPPYRVNGFMISGFASPNEKNIFYPSILGLELRKILGRSYRIHLNYHNPKYDDLNIFFNDLFDLLNIRLQSLKYLLFNKKWDFFIAVISCTDFLLHVTWRLIDPTHPFFDETERRNFYPLYLEFWRRIDRIVELIKKAATERDTDILILSDHGFQAQKGVFNILKFLVDRGYTLPKVKNKFLLRIRSLIYNLSTTSLGMRVALMLPKGLRHKLMRSTGYDVSSIIDFENSIAYTLDNTIIFAPIYLNYKLINNYEEYNKAIENIIRDLEEVSKTIRVRIDIYRIVDEETWKRREKGLPDLILSVNNWASVFIKDVYGDLYNNKSIYKRFSGTHALHGILVGYGNYIKDIIKNYENPHIRDVYNMILQYYKE